VTLKLEFHNNKIIIIASHQYIIYEESIMFWNFKILDVRCLRYLQIKKKKKKNQNICFDSINQT